jgi:hypothetical protein
MSAASFHWLHNAIKTVLRFITHLLAIANTTRSFLTVTTGKLITNLWHFYRSNSNLAKLETLLVDSDHDLRQNSIRLF